MEYIFEIGDFGLRWYSTLVALGLAMGAWVATIEAKRKGIDEDHVFGLLLIALPLSLIGARAYHVIDQWNEIYTHDPARVFLINEGGIAIYGAVIGAIAGVAIYSWWKKVSLLQLLDIGAPGFILGQAIGRWGNFFNEELYGTPSNLPWAIDIPFSKRLAGYEGFSSFHPLFLYESLLNLMAFGLMMWAGRRWAGRLKDGDMVLIYGLFYGSVRLSLEPLRIDNWTVGAVPVATIFSGLAVAGCGGALLYRHWWVPRHRPPEALAAAGEQAEKA